MIGATIKSLLTGSNTLANLISTRIFPYVMNEETALPAVVYTIDSLDANYNKGGWANDDISFSVFSFSKDYTELQSVVSAVRNALELKKTGSGSQHIEHIYLTGINEGYDPGADGFFSRLSFNVKINTY